VSRPLRLTLVRAIHTLIYVVMAASTLAVLYGGLTGAKGGWLRLALALTCVESAIFLGCGLKCPLTAVVAHLTPDGAQVSDTFFPERLTRHTLSIFGPLLLLGVGLLAFRHCFSGR
jgi:hypothetical protein